VGVNCGREGTLATGSGAGGAPWPGSRPVGTLGVPLSAGLARAADRPLAEAEPDARPGDAAEEGPVESPGIGLGGAAGDGRGQGRAPSSAGPAVGAPEAPRRGPGSRRRAHHGS
jgi:hypothetical protein